MNRYPIEGHVEPDGWTGDEKYQIVFSTPKYNPDSNRQVDAMEHDPAYRELLFRQLHEEHELAAFHATERLRYLLRQHRKDGASERA